MVDDSPSATAALWSLERLNDNPLYQALGIEITLIEDRRCQSQLRPSPAACWPLATQPHGGILFTQMDTTMATAVLGAFEPGKGNCTTIDLSIQYLAPAVGDVFECTAHVVGGGGRVWFLRGETVDSAGNLVAAAQGSFRVFRAHGNA